MDDDLKNKLHENNLRFKTSLDRIIAKYSKLQDHDGGVEVDLCNIKTAKLQSYMRLSQTRLDSLESKSLTDLREESLGAQDTTGCSQLNSTYQDGTDETSDTSSQFSVQDNGTVSSLDESQRNASDMELQPEDQDKELEMSLRSHGSSLVELYPSMISRIERAWHRQHVSTAANFVLRRYRRWRQQSNRSNLNNTFIVTQRHTNSNPKKTTSKVFSRNSSSSSMKGHFSRTETTPLQTETGLHDWQAPHGVLGKELVFVRKERHQPIHVMDFSDSSEPSKLKEISLNETFTVSQLSPSKLNSLEEQASAYAVSPSRPYNPTAKASIVRRSLSAEETAGSSTFASEFTTAIQIPDIYSSPVRQSPLKTRVTSSLRRSPHLCSRNPKEYSVSSGEPVRQRSLSTSLASPTKRPAVQLRMLYPEDSHQSFPPQLRSPQPATATGGHRRLTRHLSFDSSLPLSPVSYSPKQVDEDFMKLYHKFVCQNKSAFFNGPPCRLCARGSELSRGHSSSALAALALSPHRSVLRKRNRELAWDSHPQSKRLREEHCAYSPGSKRHRREMLRRVLSPSELKLPRGGGPSSSFSNHSMIQRFSSQQPSAHEENWRNQRQVGSAADFSGMGSSLESKMTNGYSPRKWR